MGPPHHRGRLWLPGAVTSTAAVVVIAAVATHPAAAAETDLPPPAWPPPPLPWDGRPHPPPTMRAPPVGDGGGGAVPPPYPPPPAGTNAPVHECGGDAAATNPACAYMAGGEGGAYEAVGDREQALAERLAAAGVTGRMWLE